MVEEAKQHFLDEANKSSPKFDASIRHLLQVEKWGNNLLNKYSNADKEIVLTAIWLHDIGQIIGNQDIDHAINSETETKKFLKKIDINQDLIDKVAHCVRSHRCKDVQPETLEAKIVAVADSVSHMTDIVYINMINKYGIKEAEEKFNRDLRDVGLIPEFKKEIEPFYQAWIQLFKSWPI